MMPVKLFVAVPVYGGVCVEFLQCLMKLQANPPCEMSLQFLPGDSLVSRARNTLTASFLKTDCTHLLFIDSDLIFSPDTVRRLIAHDKEVIGGFYPKKKQGAVEWVCNSFVEGQQPPQPDGLQSLRYMGTGFLMVRRSVFEQMIEKYGATIAYHPDPAPHTTEYDIWPVGPYTDAKGFTRYLSEDWYFCQRWLDMGGTVWGDTHIHLHHVGQAVYPLQTQMAELIAQSPAP